MAHLDHHHHVDLDTTLEFINTLEHSAEGDRDDLTSLDAALDWLVAHDVMHAEAADEERGRGGQATRLASVHRMRGALREIADAVVLGRRPAPGTTAAVNRALAGREIPQLAETQDGVAVGHRHGPDPLSDAMARLAQPLADALAHGRPDRLRVCANDECRWVFFDTSRTGRRRWCDMSSCGNRAKAARHRARLRGGAL